MNEGELRRRNKKMGYIYEVKKGRKKKEANDWQPHSNVKNRGGLEALLAF